MFGNNVIKKRVMDAINKRVEDTQKAYEVGVKELEKELDDKKAKLADNLVEGLLGKLM